MVSWYSTDDEVKPHKHRFKNVLYFPDSTLNILSTTEFSEYMKYDEVTWVLTKSKYSIFTWYIGRYKKTIAHSEIVFQS